MKQTNLILIASVLLLIFTSGASASFTATADETDPFSPWDAVTAGATTSSPSWDGTNYYIAAPAGASMYKNFTTTQNYWAFDMNSNNPGAIISDVYFRRDSTGANSCIMEFASAPGSLIVSTAGFGNCAGLVNINYPLVKNQWYTFRITDLGNSLRFDILNTTNGTTVKTQTIADIPGASGTFIQFAMNQNAFKYDNIFVDMVSPSTATSIVFENSLYVIGDQVFYDWEISASDWNAFFGLQTFSTRITDPDGFVVGDASLIGIAQTGTMGFVPTKPGAYTAELQVGLIFRDTLATGATYVQGQSSARILINSTVPYHTQVPVTYDFGIGGITLNNAIQTYYLNPNTGLYEFEHSFFGLSSGTNIRNVYFEKVGNYILKLRNVATDTTYKQTSTTTTFAAPETTLNITKTTINITKNNYGYGDTIFGNYTIDSTNWTAGQIYLDVFNWDQGIVTTQMQGTGTGWVDISTSQVGNILVQLLNVPANQNFAQTTFIAGNNSLRIMLKNTTGVTNVLAFTNFTMSNCNADGYCLLLSKYSVLTNEKFFAYATVPEAGAKLVLINTGSDLKTGKLLSQLSSTASNPISVPISISNAGNYAVVILNPANDSEAMQNVVVTTAAVSPTATVSPEQAANNASNAVVSLLSSLTFWAFLMVAGVMMYVGWKTKNYIPTSIVGMTGAGVFTFIGWIPAWLFFSVLVITAYLLAKNQVSGETDTGQNK